MTMSYLYLIPISLLLALIALIAFLWALKSEQYDDLDGAAVRILIDDDTPLPPAQIVASTDKPSQSDVSRGSSTQ